MWSSRLWKELLWLLQRVRDCKPYEGQAWVVKTGDQTVLHIF